MEWQKQKNRANKKAFTIVELVIVIAVLSILLGLGFVGGNQMLNRSRNVALESQMGTFEDAIVAMVHENTRLGLWETMYEETNSGNVNYDTGVTNREYIVDLLNKYMDSDCQFKIEGSDIVSTINDPYGTPYQLAISVEKNLLTPEEEVMGKNSAEIRFFVKSAGKNKQTPSSGIHATDVVAVKADTDDVIVMVECVKNSVESTIIEDIVVDIAAVPAATSNDGDVVFAAYTADPVTVTLNGAYKTK